MKRQEQVKKWGAFQSAHGISSALLVAGVLALGACGGDDDAAAAGSDLDQNVRDAVRDGDIGSLIRAAASGDPEALTNATHRQLKDAIAQESRPLPYPRQLQTHLPAELDDYPVAELSVTSNLSSGVSAAEGRYREEAIRQQGAIELEIAYFGKDTFGRQKLEFGMYRHESTKVKGFDCVYVDREGEDEDSILRVQIADYFMVTATSDRASIKTMQSAVESVDLKALKKAHDNGEIFEPSKFDRMLEARLERSEIEELIPRKLKTLECTNISSSRQDRGEQPHTRVEGFYPVGRIIVTDLVDPERVSREMPLDLNEHTYVKVNAMSGAEVVHQPFERGVLKGVLARITTNTKGMEQVVLRGAVGGIVVEFEGRWVKAQELDEGLSPQMRENMLEFQKQTGVGFFEDLDELVDCVLNAFDLERLEAIAALPDRQG